MTDSRKITGFIIVFLINLIFFTAHATLSIFPAHLASAGASKTYIAMFVNINSLALVIFVIFFGRASAGFYKKKALSAGYIILCITALGMYFFVNNLPLLLLLRFISSVSYAFHFTLIFNIAHDLIPDNRRTGLIAIFGTSGLLADPLGSLLGEYLAAKTGYPSLFLAVSCLAVIVCILTLFVYAPKRPVSAEKKSKTFTEIIQQKRYRSLIILSLVFGGIYSILVTYIPVYTKLRFDKAIISYFFIPFAVASISIRLVSVSFIDKIKKRLILGIGLISGLTAMILMLFLYSWYMLVVIGFMYGICHSLLFPSLSAEFVHKSLQEDRMNATNVYLCFHLAGTLVWGVLLGFLGDLFGFSFMFITMSGVIFLAILMSFKYKQSPVT